MSERPFQFAPMNASDASAIAGWRYDGAYAFYDMDADPHDYAFFLDPASWPDRHWAVRDERGELIGFFAFTPDPISGLLDIGLGLRPDLTGRGLGLAFVRAGLAFGREHYATGHFRLFVATFNQRAIRVYERAGFRATRTFLHHTNGGNWEFVEMRLEWP